MNYIALLRGINVGGKNKIKMADLKQVLNQLQLENISTYIQSGNVLFNSKEKDKTKLENKISNSIKVHFDIDVPVIVKTQIEILDILEKNPFSAAEDLGANKIYFVILKNTPTKENIAIMQSYSFENETFYFTPSCVYLRCGLGAGKAKCNNNFFESKLKVGATSRNYRTMCKLRDFSIN